MQVAQALERCLAIGGSDCLSSLNCTNVDFNQLFCCENNMLTMLGFTHAHVDVKYQALFLLPQDSLGTRLGLTCTTVEWIYVCAHHNFTNV